ncbi:MAG TPA: Hsp20/alpha crystallin family protein [Bacteroidota bacterium]|nr:Hsp20/alpha crystallin family protein [Bacteroidota bacterium]
MTLIRWNPVRDVTAWRPINHFVGDIANMQSELDRMFDRFRGGILDDSGMAAFMPPVDITEDETNFTIRAEVPGVEKKDVSITVQNGVLTVRGEKKEDVEKKDKNVHRVERSYGSFQRSFTLPTTVKSDKIEASYDNGVLTISIPKSEESKPKEIEVKVK